MSDTEQNPERRIALFQRKEIRRTIHNNEYIARLLEAEYRFWQNVLRRTS
jgi:hypothetical protein